jgi:hypothetical protein
MPLFEHHSLIYHQFLIASLFSHLADQKFTSSALSVSPISQMLAKLPSDRLQFIQYKDHLKF